MLASVPLRRWTTVHNIFIRKDTDNIKINRLRVIHKLDAELNLIRREFVTRRIMKNLEKHKKLANEQYGGRTGRSAIDVVLLKEPLESYISHDAMGQLSIATPRRAMIGSYRH
jgi:hypothetical protein